MSGELTPSLVRTEGAILTPLNQKIFRKICRQQKSRLLRHGTGGLWGYMKGGSKFWCQIIQDGPFTWGVRGSEFDCSQRNNELSALHD